MRNIIFAITTIINQQWEHVIVFTTRVRLVQLSDVPEDDAPSFDLLFCVIDMRQILIVLVVEGDVGKIFPAKMSKLLQTLLEELRKK